MPPASLSFGCPFFPNPMVFSRVSSNLKFFNVGSKETTFKLLDQVKDVLPNTSLPNNVIQTRSDTGEIFHEEVSDIKGMSYNKEKKILTIDLGDWFSALPFKNEEEANRLISRYSS